MYAKPFWVWLLIITSIWIVSYWAIQVYSYATTTTLEDVTEKAMIFKKAESDLVQAKLEYCYDHRLDSKKCEEVMIWTGKLAPTTSKPPSKIVEESKAKFAYAKLYQDVCKKQINSHLCKDRKLFDRLYQLTEERLPWKNFYPILLGITNAESSLGLNFAKDTIWGTCAGRNNWGWIKWKKTDDGKSVKDQQIPDKFWCYLYKFDSIEDYWISKVNTIRYGYPWCVDSPTPIKCMSYAYVGDRNVAESSWINNVSIFLN